MPCFFKTISTFATGQREILPFLESLFNLSREHSTPTLRKPFATNPPQKKPILVHSSANSCGKGVVCVLHCELNF